MGIGVVTRASFAFFSIKKKSFGRTHTVQWDKLYDIE